MANILITDLLEESAYLLRSLLRGRGFAVSIAINPGEARAKLETGLFDTLVIDLCEPSEANLAIAAYANTLLPGLPVVALTREEEQAKIKGIELFGKIFRPIKGARVNDVVSRAAAHAQSLGTRRKNNRLEVDIPLSFEVAGERFDARVTDLSERGFAIDGPDELLTDERLNRISAFVGKDGVKATLMPAKGQKFEAQGRIAFVDRYRRYTGKMIGVIFNDLAADTKGYVDSLLNPPAPEAEAVAAAPAGGEAAPAA